MTTFLTIALCIAPWIIFPIGGLQDQMRLPQMAFLGLTYFGMICLFFLNGAKYVYRNKWLALLSAWVFYSIFCNFLLPFCLEWVGKGRVLNTACLEQTIFFILGLFVSYIALSYFDKEDYLRIAKALCLSSSLIACWAILQYIGLDPFGKIAVYRCGNQVSACLDNPNIVGNYLSLCLPLYLIFNERKYLLGLLLTVLGILATRSNFSLFLSSFSMLLFCFIYFRRNKIIVASLSVLSAIGIWLMFAVDLLKLKVVAGPLSGRWDCWKVALTHLRDNPLFGQGLGIWKTWAVHFGIRGSETWWMSVHNDWLEKAIELGLIGIVLIGLVVVNSIRNFRFTEKLNYAYFCMFISFLIMMGFSFPLVTPTVGFLGLISWWAIERL